MSGFVLLHRDVFDHPFFRNEAFTEREAWIWLICEAAHSPHQRRVAGEVHTLERGQIVASSRHLARVWRWNEPRVRRFIRRLIGAEMVANETVLKTTRLTICNYEDYQEPRRGSDAPTTRQRRNKERMEIIKQGDSVSYETGRTDVPPDCKTQLFGPVKDWLVDTCNLPDRTARSFLGKCLKLTGDDAGSLLDVFRLAYDARPADVQGWVMARLKPIDRKKRYGITDAFADILGSEEPESGDHRQAAGLLSDQSGGQ